MPDTSPTGTPFIPPRYVPLVGALLTALNAGLVAISQSNISPGAKVACAVVLSTLGPLVGLFSPGLRKSDGGAS